MSNFKPDYINGKPITFGDNNGSLYNTVDNINGQSGFKLDINKIYPSSISGSYAAKDTVVNNNTTSVGSTNSLATGMVSNAANIGSKFNANGSIFTNIGSDVSKVNPTALGFENQEELQKHLVKIGNNYYLKQNEGFMQKYGTGIQVGLGIGQLGLGLASYLDNHKMMKQSIENMKEQLNQSRAEYARLNALRSKLTKSYNSK